MRINTKALGIGLSSFIKQNLYIHLMPWNKESSRMHMHIHIFLGVKKLCGVRQRYYNRYMIQLLVKVQLCFYVFRWAT